MAYPQYGKVDDSYRSSQHLVPPYQQQQQQQYNPYAAPPGPPPTYPPQGYAQPAPPAMPYAAPYSQPTYAPPPGPPPATSGGEKFNKAPKYKNLWATILFLLTLAGFAACAAVGLSNLHLASDNQNAGTDPNRNRNNQATNDGFVVPAPKDIGGILAASVGTGFVISAVYFLLMQRFAGKLIRVTMVLTVVVLVALAAYYAAVGAYVAAIIWFLMAALNAFFLWSWRDRIPFAKIILKTVTNITSQYPATLFTGFVGLVLEAAFTALWIASFAGMMQYFDSNKSSNGLRYLVIVFMLFTLYYVSQVISNTIHVIVSGLFATYYFMGTPGPDGKVTVPVRNPTAASAKRALTTSFGPICFGSLVIALIQTVRALLRMAAQQSADDGNLAGALCAACAECCLSFIEGLIQYFNKWAFVQVAVYGKDYIQAAKDTWELCKTRGVDAIINDQLIGSVLGIGGLLVGLVCGFVAFLYVRFADSIPKDTLHYVVFILIAFFIGLSEFYVLSNVIDSGATATFVCLAEDPAALQRTKPELYEAIRNVYPQVAFPGY